MVIVNYWIVNCTIVTAVTNVLNRRGREKRSRENLFPDGVVNVVFL